MPVSAYVQSAIFLILAAVALFAAAGTLAILGFWLYLAILAAIIVASLLALDPGLLRERKRPGGHRPPLALRTIVVFLHWIVAGLDRDRFHWSDGVPSWIEALGLIALAAGYVLCFWAMAVKPTMRAASAGAWCPAFGEAEQGFASPSRSTSIRIRDIMEHIGAMFHLAHPAANLGKMPPIFPDCAATKPRQ
jgi:hypothetical protein